MKMTWLGVALAGVVLPAFALPPTGRQAANGTGDSAQSGGLICWYNDQGNLSDVAAAPAGATPGSSVPGSSGADHAVGRVVAGSDASACPSKLPVSSHTAN